MAVLLLRLLDFVVAPTLRSSFVCLFIYVTVGQLFQLYEDVLEQKISKDLPVLPPQINQTPFFSVNVTGGTDLCRWPPSCKRRSTGSAPPRGRPDQDPSQSWRSRSAGKATWLRVYNPRPVQISGRRCDDAAEGFILQTALASMSAAFPPPRRTPTGSSFPSEGRQDGRGGGGGSLLHALAALNDLTEEETKLERHHHHSVTTGAGFVADSCLLAAPLSVLR